MWSWVYLVTVLLACGWFAEPAAANVVGSDYHNFNPSLSTVDVTTVHTGKTLGRGRLGLGLFLDNAINTLPYFNLENEDNRDVEKSYNDSVTSLELQAIYGITDIWDIAIAAPYVVYQSLKDEQQPHGYFKRLGNTEIRLSTKVHLIQLGIYDAALVGIANYNRVEDNPYTGNVSWPAQSLELAQTLSFGLVQWSVNLGYRWREGTSDENLKDEENLPIDPFNDQILASTALVLDLPVTDLDVIGEIYGSYARQDVSSFSPRNPSVLEDTLGVRYPLPYNLQWHAGIGTEMRHAVASSDFRVYTGLRWVVDTRRPAVPAAAAAPAPVAPALPPAPAIPVSERSPDAMFELDDIYFKFDSTELRVAAGYRVMELLAQALRERPIDRVVIEGHACSLGSDAYNMDLSDRRANSVEHWLIVNNGVPPEKLVTVAWGERHPKFSNAQESTRMLNRRVTFKIFYSPRTAQSPQAPARLNH